MAGRYKFAKLSVALAESMHVHRTINSDLGAFVVMVPVFLHCRAPRRPLEDGGTINGYAPRYDPKRCWMEQRGEPSFAVDERPKGTGSSTMGIRPSLKKICVDHEAKFES